MIGDKFDRLTVVEYSGKNKHGMKMVKCKCDCGKTITTRENCLKRGETKSCGCLRRELSAKKMTKHGKYYSGIYRSWQLMKNRCCDINNHRYYDYGGRGIKVCQRWLDGFEFFLEDMGVSYSEGLTIDRIDTNGDYTPENCKWSTVKEQCRNRRNNVFINTVWGKITVAEAAEKSGLSDATIFSRIKNGWEEKDLLAKTNTLNIEQIEEIKSLYGKERTVEIAKRFKVSASTVRNIKNGVFKYKDR